MASEVVRQEFVSLVEFLNKISFLRLFDFKLETKSNYFGQIFYVLNVLTNILMSL